MEPVVTVTATVMSGTVVRWYRDLGAAGHNRPLVSASSDGVVIHGEPYLHTVAPEWLTAAGGAYERLLADRRVDLGGLATHRRRGFGGPLEPVERQGA